MGLREEAIRAYREKTAAKEAEQAEEKRKSLALRIAEAQESIRVAFALAECPHLVVTDRPSEYWPEVTFEVDGVVFLYDLGRCNIEVKVSCPKCSNEWHHTIRTKAGALDLSDLGFELCILERHDCPADNPPPVPRPQPETVTWRKNSLSVRLIELLDEYIEEAIEQNKD